MYKSDKIYYIYYYVVIFGNEHDKLEYYNLRDNRPCTSDDYELLEELDEWIEDDNE